MNSKTNYILSKLNTELFEIVEELNYSGIICKVNPNDYDKLEKILKLDHCNKLYRLDYIKENNYFCIENCDLEDITPYYNDGEDFTIETTLKNCINDGYIILDITFTENGFILKELEESKNDRT